MYGLLLENMAEFIKTTYGEDMWERVRREAMVDIPSFSTHQVYPESLLPRLAKVACKVMGLTDQEFFENMGTSFVSFVGQYGYDRVLSVLGRHVRDFLNGLDNLHEYLKFSYPRMRPPSFFCENETASGMVLHYRSKRKGYGFYTMGQIKQVAHHFYDTKMQIELVREVSFMDSFHVTFQLTFDNQAYREANSFKLVRDEQTLPIRANIIFELFPFSIAFTSDLVVRNLGQSLLIILPELLGKHLNNWFDLVRPLVGFRYSEILKKTNNIFELVSIDSPSQMRKLNANGVGIDGFDFNEDDVIKERNLRLKGQMIYFDEWRMIVFLGTPVMPDLEVMIHSGLFINDLSMHDFSRDLMLAGTQQSIELKLALDQEQLKSKKLEESMKKLDDEMKRTDELLYQMIPKEVANRLRKGTNPVDTCEVFESVTILFSDVVTFTEICSRLSPMQVVSMLNSMYSIFDHLTELNGVYKVETIGDAYMVVSGAPEKNSNHADKVCDMALDMVEGITGLTDPSTGDHIQIRVGVHTGTVVAGVVGLKMPRYCLFGDTVNTASRMESMSTAMKIHVSETTRDCLSNPYHSVERGEVMVKGKGHMKTYWLESRRGRRPLQEKLKVEELLTRSADVAQEEGSPGVGSSSRRSYTPISQLHWTGERPSSVLSSGLSIREVSDDNVLDIKRHRSRSALSGSQTDLSPQHVATSTVLSNGSEAQVALPGKQLMEVQRATSPPSVSQHKPTAGKRKTTSQQTAPHSKAGQISATGHPTVGYLPPVSPGSCPQVTLSAPDQATSRSRSIRHATPPSSPGQQPAQGPHHGDVAYSATDAMVKYSGARSRPTPIPVTAPLAPVTAKEVSRFNQQLERLHREYGEDMEQMLSAQSGCCPGPTGRRPRESRSSVCQIT